MVFHQREVISGSVCLLEVVWGSKQPPVQGHTDWGTREVLTLSCGVSRCLHTILMDTVSRPCSGLASSSGRFSPLFLIPYSSVFLAKDFHCCSAASTKDLDLPHSCSYACLPAKPRLRPAPLLKFSRGLGLPSFPKPDNPSWTGTGSSRLPSIRSLDFCQESPNSTFHFRFGTKPSREVELQL